MTSKDNEEEETSRLLESGIMGDEDSRDEPQTIEMIETKQMKQRRWTNKTTSATTRMRKSPSLESLDRIIEFDENNGKLLIHLITVPLIILATCALGLILVFLKEILIPFVIAFFFVNLLRPLITLLTTPIRCRRLAREIEYRGKLLSLIHI